MIVLLTHSSFFGLFFFSYKHQSQEFALCFFRKPTCYRGSRPKPEIFFWSWRLGWTLLLKERYGDSLSGRGSNTQPSNLEVLPLSWCRPLFVFIRGSAWKDLSQTILRSAEDVVLETGNQIIPEIKMFKSRSADEHVSVNGREVIVSKIQETEQNNISCCFRHGTLVKLPFWRFMRCTFVL